MYCIVTYTKGFFVGLFDFFKGDISDEHTIDNSNNHEFKDIIIESTNVDKDLKRLADKYHLETKELDFTIISYRTFYRFKKEDKYKLLKEIHMQEIFTRENLLNPEFGIKQQYKLNIFKKRSSKSFPVKILLGTNSDFTKIMATVKKNQNVTYHDRLASDILTEINKKKLKQGILIGLFEKKLKDEINRLTSHIMINKAVKEDFKIVICEGLERIKENKEFVNFIFQEKRIDENRNIALRDQTNLSTVKKDEIVIEVIKSQKGENGRNCKGEFLPKSIEYAKSDFKLDDLDIGENLYKKDIGNKILFLAKKDGYVVQNGNKFDISDDVVVDQISIKTTGSIRAGDKDIKVNVQANDDSIDAIGSGVVLDTKEVKVKGNVANNAKITADLVEIDGQTHQSSSIKGKKVKINLHRGVVEADKVDIKTLEGGKVICDEIFIDTLSGGEIRAKKISINRLISNSNLYASEIIEISEVDGSSNHIHIDPKAQRGFDEIVTNLEKEISDVEYEIKKHTKDLKSLKRKILSEQETIEEIKQRIMEIKAQKQKVPQTMINKIKEDKSHKLNFNKTVTLIKDLKQKSEELTAKIKSFNESIFDAKVIVNTPWKEYNEIIFHLVDPKKDITRVMNENEVANILGLKVTKDNEYIIANLD